MSPHTSLISARPTTGNRARWRSGNTKWRNSRERAHRAACCRAARRSSSVVARRRADTVAWVYGSQQRRIGSWTNVEVTGLPTGSTAWRLRRNGAGSAATVLPTGCRMSPVTSARRQRRIATEIHVSLVDVSYCIRTRRGASISSCRRPDGCRRCSPRRGSRC